MTELPPPAGGASPDGPIPLEAVFSRAWSLLRANWVIALPPVIVVTLCGLLVIPFIASVAASAAGHTQTTRPIGVSLPGWAIASLAAAYAVIIVGGFAAVVSMFAMADAAWSRSRATFEDGFSALRTCSWPLTAASVALLGVGIVALILALPTLGLSMLAYIVFTIYVLPAVVGGRRGGFAAVAESFRLVRTSFVRSAIGIALLLAGSYAISFAGSFAVLPMMAWFMKVVSEPSHLTTLPPPPIPLIVACGALYAVITLVSLAYYGYYALVLVGMYRSLVGPGDAVDSGAGVAAAAPHG